MAVSRELLLFAGLLALGLVLANTAVVVLSLLPLLLAAAQGQLGGLTGAEVQRREGRLSLWSGETGTVENRLVVRGGRGIVAVEDRLPEQLSVVEGRPLEVRWKGPGELSMVHRYSVRGSRRGSHTLGPVRVRLLPLSMSGRAGEITVDGRQGVLVQQRSVDVKRLRQARLANRVPLPARGTARLGTPTTDFREIRRYIAGDRFRSINWKATARQGSDALPPLVNDLEAEGRRTVLLLLDAGPGMSQGTASGTLFEHAVQASLGLTQFFISRNCEVGLRAFGTSRTLLPRAGLGQQARIAQVLLELEAGARDESLTEAVRPFRPYLGREPMVVVVTSVRRDNFDRMGEGARRLLALAGRRGRLVVVHISGHEEARSAEARAAAELLALGNAPLIQALSGMGAMVFDWDPREQTFEEFMVLKMGRGA